MVSKAKAGLDYGNKHQLREPAFSVHWKGGGAVSFRTRQQVLHAQEGKVLPGSRRDGGSGGFPENADLSSSI